MKKQLSVLLVLFVFIATLSPQAFAGIPIVDNPAQNQKKVIKHTKSKKRVAKWKQKLATKVLAKNAEIGENRTAAIVFAILIPFVGVAIFQDGITRDFWATLILTVLGFIPGMIYALSIVLKRY